MTKERKKSAQSPAAFASRFNTEIKTRNRERRSASRRLAATQAAAGSGRNDLLPPLELVDVRLDDLKLSQRRLRKRDPTHIREVANSIARLGYSKPILIGPDNEVIDGETVIEGVRLLGLDRLSCIRVGHLNDSERRLLRLAINRLAEKGEWDFEALRLELNELILVDAPIEIGGFAPDEIDQILSLDPDDGVERAPLAPEAGVEPVARVGDLYRLGSHYLLCGDATDAAILRRLMSAGAKPRLGRRAVSDVGNRSLARVVLTDEPYNVHIAGNVTGGRHRSRDRLGRNERAGISRLQRNLDGRCFALSRQRRLARDLHRLARLFDCRRRGRQSRPRSCQFGRLVENERWHGQPLSFPARAPAAVQKGRRAAYQ